MEVHFKPEKESQLNDLATRSGRATDDLVEDALAGYLREVTQTREMLDSRDDDVKTGRVKPMDGDEALARLRQTSTDRHAPRS